MLHLDKYGITSLFLIFGQNIHIAYVPYISELFNVKQERQIVARYARLTTSCNHP